ncbi:PulJ/GspJ family protein [Oceanobacillus halophilus]|uniref:Prepilin-type N-terminal cleavage/methylation domain-containing protein n=1 Tax=Oceanobacillus halophilus TaxID=930130 RepID=A0A494ZXS3_9BACI|nr:hypothetical protein [Oceanobacillus halophilus]RKQ29883.1 hypothetical protein D8M06_16835 [Oceanobacillus halophilus]
MKFRQFFNEKGMTLVELLGALGLFTVVIALSSTVIFQILGSEEQSHDKISLTTEANITINELRNQFEKDYEKLCIKDKKYEYSFDEDEVTNATVDGNCLEVEPDSSISFKLIASNEDNQRLEIKTSFEKNNSKTLRLELLNKDKPPKDFIEGEDIYKCTFDSDTKFDSFIDIKANGKSANAKCGSTYEFKKNVAFLDGFHIKNWNKLIVAENMYVIGTFDVDNKSEIHVTGNLYIESEENVKKNANINVEGTICRVLDVNEIDECEEEIKW